MPTWAKTSNIKGATGAQGAQGIQGPAGASVIGPQGPPGNTGATGAPGQGVPAGGGFGYVLAKNSVADYDTAWVQQSGNLSLSWPMLAPNGTTAAPSYSFTSQPGTGLHVSGGNLYLTDSGVDIARTYPAGYFCLGPTLLGWGASVAGAQDVILTRDAANTLAQRNGTNPQTLRVYNTYTDASNYERFGITWSGNLYLTTAYSGTGAARNIFISAAGNLQLGANQGQQWQITAGGHFLANTDNTYDIGASGANRPRNVFVAGYLYAPSVVVSTSVYLNTQAPQLQLMGGTGVPAAGLGNNGDYYLRSDTPATANQRLYVKSAGAWAAIL